MGGVSSKDWLHTAKILSKMRGDPDSRSMWWMLLIAAVIMLVVAVAFVWLYYRRSRADETKPKKKYKTFKDFENFIRSHPQMTKESQDNYLRDEEGIRRMLGDDESASED